MTISRELDKFAKDILTQAEDEPFDRKLEAFKLLTAYYIGITKAKKSEQPDDENSFDKLKSGIKKAGEYHA